MSQLLKELLEEVRANENANVEKLASAPNEAPSPEQQNNDILESSQAMISKIDNFMQQVNGMGQDSSQENQSTGDGSNPAMTTGEPGLQDGAGSPTVKLEVPAGMSVKLASVNVTDSDSALRTIVGLMPSYFGE